MIEVLFRGAIAAAFLFAATLLPLMFALTGDPVAAATATAVLVPVAALLLAGAMVECHRWRTDRAAVQRWARTLHPAGKSPTRAAAPRPAAAPTDPGDGETSTTILRKVAA